MSFNFWEMGDFKEAHLSKLNLPPEEITKINDWVKNEKRFLVFLGTPGIGKSYLIAALIHSLIEQKKGHWFRYMHERDLFSIMRDCIAKNWDYESEIKRICETPYIFLDDIGSSQTTEFQKEVLQNFIDTRWIMGYPTMITSNIFLKQMYEVFEPRFISRLKDKRNTIIELNWEDKRQI